MPACHLGALTSLGVRGTDDLGSYLRGLLAYRILAARPSVFVGCLLGRRRTERIWDLELLRGRTTCHCESAVHSQGLVQCKGSLLAVWLRNMVHPGCPQYTAHVVAVQKEKREKKLWAEWGPTGICIGQCGLVAGSAIPGLNLNVGVVGQTGIKCSPSPWVIGQGRLELTRLTLCLSSTQSQSTVARFNASLEESSRIFGAHVCSQCAISRVGWPHWVNVCLHLRDVCMHVDAPLPLHCI